MTAMANTLDCCLIDDHCDLLPFLHSFYRLHGIPFSKTPITLLHVDAHPDLSLPSDRSGMDQWKQPDRLYELLDSDGGIAEFLLPLFATSLLQSMIWIRPAWSNQLPDGEVCFQLFEAADPEGRQRPFVNYCCPYYLDNDDFSASTQGTDVHLTVCMVEGQPERCNRWILDICLDYFLTNNPFLADLQQRIESDLSTLPSTYSLRPTVDGLLSTVLDVITNLSYRHKPTRVVHRKRTRSSTDRQTCLSAFKQVLIDGGPLSALQAVSDSQLCEQLLQALPLLSTETKQFIADTNTLLLLPHQTFADSPNKHEVILESIAKLKQFLITWTDNGRNRPLFVCVCRSSDLEQTTIDNGYTPRADVDWLQEQVLAMVREVFTDCQLVVQDMREEPVELAQQYLATQRLQRRAK